MHRIFSENSAAEIYK